MLGYIEMTVVDTFEQIQHGSNLSPAILAKTFRSLNYYHRNHEGRFLGCALLLYIWIRSHIVCEGITFTKSYFPKTTPIIEQLETKKMLDFISPRSQPTTVDGSIDVSTPSTVSMWKPILGTPFRTLEDD